jgi:hypothetical protein
MKKDCDYSTCPLKNLVEHRHHSRESDGTAIVELKINVDPVPSDGVAVRFGQLFEKGSRTWKSLAEEANDLCAKRFDEIEQLKKLVAIYKRALMQIVESGSSNGALDIAREALSPSMFEASDPRMNNAWASKEVAPPSAVELKHEPPTVFDHELQTHRARLDNFWKHPPKSMTYATKEDVLSDAVRFLLAVAHAPGEPELEERVKELEGKMGLICSASFFDRIKTIESRVEAVCGVLEGSRRETAMRDGFARAYGAAAQFAIDESRRQVPEVKPLTDDDLLARAVDFLDGPGSDAKGTIHYTGGPNVGKRLPTQEAEMLADIFKQIRDRAKANERALVDMAQAPRDFKEVPRIVCLCGSTRFSRAFADANLEETLKGNIVLTVGSMTHSDAELGKRITPEIKTMLDGLHLKKIELADEVLVLNVETCSICKVAKASTDPYGHCPTESGRKRHEWKPYVGESTRGEIEHALRLRKHIRFLNPQGRTGCTALFGNDTSGAEVEDTMYMLGL